jgi:hypothetical protein
VAISAGVSTRSPGGGPLLRGAGSVGEEGSMVHALRGVYMASGLLRS